MPVGDGSEKYHRESSARGAPHRRLNVLWASPMAFSASGRVGGSVGAVKTAATPGN